jgi:hypothetical protein
MNNLLQCLETFHTFNKSYLVCGFPRSVGTTIASSLSDSEANGWRFLYYQYCLAGRRVATSV